MENNNLLLIILILLIGLGVTYYFKTRPMDENKIAENWNAWSQNSEDHSTPENDKLPPSTEPEISQEADSYESALIAAKNSNKKIFLYFSASWCTVCSKLDKTLSDPTIKSELSQYIVCKIDVDQNKELTRKYKVHGIPAYKIIDGTEKVLNEGHGYKNPKQFITWLGK